MRGGNRGSNRRFGRGCAAANLEGRLCSGLQIEPPKHQEQSDQIAVSRSKPVVVAKHVMMNKNLPHDRSDYYLLVSIMRQVRILYAMDTINGAMPNIGVKSAEPAVD